MYYPFCTFPSRSKPSEVYTVNLRLPNKVSCTCGAWKYFRNKNNGCWHTDAVNELFTFVWNNNYSLRIEYNGLDGARRNTRLIKTYSVEFLNDLKISMLDTIISIFGGTDLNMELNNVFSRLARKEIKEKEGGQPKKLKDIVLKRSKKFELDYPKSADANTLKINKLDKMLEDIAKDFSITDLQIGYYKNVPVSTTSYIEAEKIYKLIDILCEIFAKRGVVIGMEIKIGAVLQFIYAMFNMVNLDSKDTKSVDLNNFSKARKIVEEKNIQE